MSNKLDDNIIQKYLFINADKIYEKINGDNKLAPTINSKKTKLLSKNRKSLNLTKKEAASIIARQHELLSANMAPTADSAIELFADPKRDNYFINSAYTINHNIIFTKNNTKYSFNIDALNRAANSNPDGFGGKFVFHKVSIVNKSKDAFTAKANFQITFHIAFNFFEDLKEDLIFGTNIANPDAPAEKISVLNLLYPYYDKKVAKDIPKKVLESKTGNGLILNQVLDMSPGARDYFKQTSTALDNIKQIHKNYHLTFYKHSINLFKSGEATLKPFDSELVLDFIAYEADPQVNENKDPNTPTISNNLFSLLFSQRVDNSVGLEIEKIVKTATKDKYYGKNLFDVFSDVLKSYNKSIQNLELAIRCKKENKDIKFDTVSIAPNDPQFTKLANEKSNEIREKIKKLVEEFSVNLFRAIINSLDIYEFDLDSSNIIAYEQQNFWEAFLKSFSGNFETSVGLGSFLGGSGVLAATGIAATGGAALLIGAGAGVLAAGVGGAISAATAEGEVINKGILLLRDSGDKLVITKSPKGTNHYSDFISGRVKQAGMQAATTARVARAGGYVDTDPQSAAQAAVDRAMKAGSKESVTKSFTLKEEERKITSETQQIKVQFILFGQLIELINSLRGTEDINIVIGGKTIPQDSNFNSLFLNYYYVPIDYYKFLQFLNTKIIQREGYNYNSEVFLREIVETFLKETVLQDGVVSGIIKDLIPTNVVTSVHLVDDSKAKDFLDKCEDDIVDDAQYNALKKSFILSKNLEPAKQQGRKLKKIYTITADEEIKYYNFYAEYNDWRFRYKTGQPNTSALFQEFIISKYQMPCLRTKAVDAYGSILINKNLHFSRKDNPNLLTGQTIDNSALLRLPYVVSGAYKPYIFFFLDVSSFIFVAPPDKRDGSMDTVDTFGYSGLYIIKNSSFEYNFQLLDNNNAPLFPNEKSKCELVGQLITYGDGLVPHMNDNKPFTTQDLTKLCTDPQPVSPEPAEEQ